MVGWKVRKTGNGSCDIYPDHPDVELATAMTMQALGLTSPQALKNLLQSLAENARVDGEVNEQRFLRLLVYVRSIEPRDEVEAMMAVQMALAHDASTTMAALQNSARGALQRDSASRAFNKASRTFVMELEALKKYRSNGQQIVIKHMNVNQGGQAIVGSVGRGETGEAVVRANEAVEVTPAERQRPRKPHKAAPPPALTAATEEVRMTLPFEAVLHPDVELVPRTAESRADSSQLDRQRLQPRPPKVNTSSRVRLQHWRRRLGARSNRNA